MSTDGCVVVVGGTAGIGKELARYYAGTGRETILTCRDPEPGGGGGRARSAGLPAASPSISPSRGRSAAPSRRSGPSSYLAIVAIQRDDNTIRDFDIDRAIELVTLKLVGFAEVVHVLLDRLVARQLDRAVRRPGQGPAISRLDDRIDRERRRSRALPGRSPGSWHRSGSNAIHPGIVGDSPFWHGKPPAVLEGHRSKTITGKLATMDDIVDATRFLLENPSADGIDLAVDNGRLMF